MGSIRNEDILHELGILDYNIHQYLDNTVLSSWLLSKNLKIKIYKTIILSLVLYGCESFFVYFERKAQTKNIWKQDPKANIQTQRGLERGMEKAS